MAEISRRGILRSFGAAAVAMLETGSMGDVEAATSTPVRNWPAGDIGGGVDVYFAPSAANYYLDYYSLSDLPSKIASAIPSLLQRENTEHEVNMLTLPLVSNPDGGDDKMDPAALQSAASGADAPDWEQIAESIKQNGLNVRSTLIRLGSEPNGDWYPWCTDGDKQLMEYYRNAYSRAATILKRGNPNLRTMLCMNAATHGEPMIAGHFAEKGLVDILGIDWYNYGNGRTLSDFTASQGTLGFPEITTAAKGYGIPMAIGEWGLNGNQNVETTRDQSSVAVFAYLSLLRAARQKVPIAFDLLYDSSGTTEYYDLAQNPLFASQYKYLWGLRKD
jgi:hypothetical protein